MSHDAAMADNLREVQLVGPDSLYVKAQAVAKAVWDFRDGLLNSDPPVVFNRDEESHYEALRRPFVARRDEFIEAAKAVLGTT